MSDRGTFAGAAGTSANRITLLRDADGDGVAEIQEAFLEELNQPFGMAMLDDTFYVGNTDGLVAFPYTTGMRRADNWDAGGWARKNSRNSETPKTGSNRDGYANTYNNTECTTSVDCALQRAGELD